MNLKLLPTFICLTYLFTILNLAFRCWLFILFAQNQLPQLHDLQGQTQQKFQAVSLQLLVHVTYMLVHLLLHGEMQRITVDSLSLIEINIASNYFIYSCCRLWNLHQLVLVFN